MDKETLSSLLVEKYPLNKYPYPSVDVRYAKAQEVVLAWHRQEVLKVLDEINKAMNAEPPKGMPELAFYGRLAVVVDNKINELRKQYDDPTTN